jgi:hypothetical protein
VTPTTPESDNHAGGPKRTYEAPRLERYGNLQQITQAVDTSGKNDGGSKGMNKTG